MNSTRWLFAFPPVVVFVDRLTLALAGGLHAACVDLELAHERVSEKLGSAPVEGPCYIVRMKSHALPALVVALSTGTTLLAQGFNLRTGTWEFNMVMQGAMPMEGVPPAMRAQIEAEMRKPRVYKSCVTAEDIKTLNLGKTEDSDDGDCKVVTSKMTPTSDDIVRQCTGDQPRSETEYFEALAPQTLRANISSRTSAGTTTMTMTAKWVAAQCKE